MDTLWIVPLKQVRISSVDTPGERGEEVRNSIASMMNHPLVGKEIAVEAMKTFGAGDLFAGIIKPRSNFGADVRDVVGDSNPDIIELAEAVANHYTVRVGQGYSLMFNAFNRELAVRPDPFSSYRSGFEVRTLRRCQRVLMVHHFQELGSRQLVKSIDFGYHPNPDTQISFLENVKVKGYRWDRSGQLFIGEMPPIAFKYSAFEPQTQRYESIAAQGNDLPPLSLGDGNMALVDLDGNGLPDVLHTLPTGFRYWKNLGNGKLDHPRTMAQVPAGITLSQPGVSFADMGGDGRADLLIINETSRGFYETTPETTWESFKHIHQVPSFDLSDPSIRLVDLTGDGLSDVLMAREQYFVWFQCLGEAGYSEPQFVPKSPDQAGLYFNDTAGRLRLADMTGDGLNDIVLVHNGRIDYWPNRGYGQFGSRITMTNAPQLEQNFDPARLFLADLDGTGCADLVYVDFNQVHFWFNQSGNGWGQQQTIQGTPITINTATVQFADFYGLGTSSLVWSYDYGQFLGSNYKVLDFCGGIKPHLLVEMDNNLGATTRVQYGSSSRHYLDDEAKGEPWATKLPFPVQVVDKVETIDHISKTKLVTTYSYHHGYFDGREREFRGFGRVDQKDTEKFDNFKDPELHGEAEFTNNAEAYHVPPVLTKTWFHTGAYLTENALMERYQTEYGKQVGGEVSPQLDPEAFELGDHAFDWLELVSDVSFDRYHEAHRSLRGSMLRQEVYSLDKSEKEFLPYVVTESRSRVKEIQPKQANAHGVYLTIPLQSITYHYERNLADPRIAHEMTLEVDRFGNVLKSVAIAYPRRNPEHPEQGQTLVTYTKNRVTNKPDEDNWYLIGVPIETQIYEITGIAPSSGQYFKIVDFYKVESDRTKTGYCLAPIIDYEVTPTTEEPQRRRIEWVRTLYRANDRASQLNSSCLPLGEVDSLALPCESLKVAFTAFYVYDAGGQRIRKVIEMGGEKSEERIYLGGFEIHRSYDSDGSVTLERQSLHVMDDQKRIALVETLTQGSNSGDESRIRYQLDNHLGSSLLEVNEDAEVISYEEYYPYGGTAYLAGKNLAEVKRKRYRYSGKERDDETGLYYYGARYYAPCLGRWMSCDPIYLAKPNENLEKVQKNSLFNEEQLNLYCYTLNNPINKVDKFGLATTNPDNNGSGVKAAILILKNNTTYVLLYA